MSRQTSTTCSRLPAPSRIGEAWTSSQATAPCAVRRSQMRTWRAPDCRHAAVGQSPTLHPTAPRSRQQQPSACSRVCWTRSRKASLAAMIFRRASRTTMPSSMLLMTVSSRSRWVRTSATTPVTESAMALNSRPSHERVSEPSAGTRRPRSPAAIWRAAVSKRCKRRSTAKRITVPMAPTSKSVMAAVVAPSQRRSRAVRSGGDLARGRLEALQAAQHGEADHRADGAHQQKRDGGRGGHQPAQIPRGLRAEFFRVVVENQNAVDLVTRIVATVAFLAVPDGYHGAKDRSAPGLDHPARSPLVRRIAVAGLACRRGDLEVGIGFVQSRRIPFGPGAVQEDEALDAGLLPETLDHLGNQRPIVFDHLMFENDRTKSPRSEEHTSELQSL